MRGSLAVRAHVIARDGTNHRRDTQKAVHVKLYNDILFHRRASNDYRMVIGNRLPLPVMTGRCTTGLSVRFPRFFFPCFCSPV
jgi:hypothetical protein